VKMMRYCPLVLGLHPGVGFVWGTVYLFWYSFVVEGCAGFGRVVILWLFDLLIGEGCQVFGMP